MDKSLILNKIKTAFNIKTNAEFARRLGISPQNLSNWYSRNTFDENLILRKFTNVNEGWLLTGEGEMLKPSLPQKSATEESVFSGKLIPFYDAEVAAGTGYGMNMEAVTHPVGMIEIGGLLNDSESALRVYGNSMVPNYPAGCVVGLKTHSDSFIEPGSVYVIETAENRYLKRLYYNKDKTAFRCVSDNHMLHDSGPMKGELYYPDFEIPFNEVIRLSRVTGVIKRNIL